MTPEYQLEVAVRESIEESMSTTEEDNDEFLKAYSKKKINPEYYGVVTINSEAEEKNKPLDPMNITKGC